MIQTSPYSTWRLYYWGLRAYWNYTAIQTAAGIRYNSCTVWPPNRNSFFEYLNINFNPDFQNFCGAPDFIRIIRFPQVLSIHINFKKIDLLYYGRVALVFSLFWSKLRPHEECGLYNIPSVFVMVTVVAVKPGHDVTVRTSVVHRLIPPVHILIIPEAFRGRVVGNMAEYKNIYI